MTNNKVYKELLEQYKSLSEEEVKALLVYKSGLAYNINLLARLDDIEDKTAFTILEEINNKDKFRDNYERYKEEISKSNNAVIKYSVFGDINFTDIYSFTDSLKEEYLKLARIKDKIKLKDDLVVYRGCSYDEEEFDISKSNLISTSIDIDKTKDFLYKDKKSKLYVLKLKKDTPVLVIPYSIVDIYDDKFSKLLKEKPQQIRINKDDRQKEVILFKDSLNFNNWSTVHKDNITIEEIDTSVKEKEKEVSVNVK
jgi:hypothetical protein